LSRLSRGAISFSPEWEWSKILVMLAS
jgi:hypothetical protein